MVRKIFFILILFLIILPGKITGQTDSFKSKTFDPLAQDGTVRTCLNTKQVSEKVPSTKYKGRGAAKIKLEGECLGVDGCVILRCNSKNFNLIETINQLEECKNPAKLTEKKKNRCDPNTPEGKNWLNNRKAMIEKDSLNNPEPGCREIGNVARGRVDLIIDEEDLAIHVDYNYYAVGKYGEIANDTGKGGNLTDEKDKAQKLSELTFDFNNTDNYSKDCVAISWDPYGRVFDAVSLEPMKNIEVTLLNIDGSKATSVLDKNWYLFDYTDEAGVYNIQVDNKEEKKYKIAVNPPKTHIFTNNLKLNPNYSSIYSDIYLRDQHIIEKQGEITHHDIPLQPIDSRNPYYMPNEDVKVVKGTLNQFVTDERNILYTGRVTFPKAKVCIADTCTEADGKGLFQIVRNNSPAEFTEVIVKKVKLTSFLNDNKKNNFFSKLFNFFTFKKVNAQQTIKMIKDEEPTKLIEKIGFEPLLRHVEGYAYDQMGNIIPKAKVNVRLKMNDKIYYTTYSDSSGFFTIYAKNLPIFEFYLEFIDERTGNKIKKTTSKFILDNKSYLEKEKINLPAGTKNNQPIIDKKNNKLKSIENNYNKPSKKIYPTTSLINKSNNISFKNGIFLILIILLILFLSIVAVFFYIKNRKID